MSKQTSTYTLIGGIAAFAAGIYLLVQNTNDWGMGLVVGGILCIGLAWNAKR